MVFLYPSRKQDAASIVDAILWYIANRGLFYNLLHDPGSDLESEVVKLLNEYLGIRNCVSVVDSPRSNGVEPTNKLILRHLNALVHDYRLVDCWNEARFVA